MIVRYGEKVMCNVTNEEGQEIPVSVIEYVVSDLKQDELSFHNPLHRQILTEAAAHIHDAGFTAERYFLAYPDPAISKLSVELISNRYQLSKYHSKSQKIVTDEERLYELVPALMINFKYAIVSEELKHMMSARPCHRQRRREMQRHHETLQRNARSAEYYGKTVGRPGGAPLTLRSVADEVHKLFTRLGLIESPRKVGSGGY